jgi:DNA-binding protein HU-beta
MPMKRLVLAQRNSPHSVTPLLSAVFWDESRRFERLQIPENFLTALNLFSKLTLNFREGRFDVIKLDIINQVVERTGVSRTKAELAVDSVFEAMKTALKKDDRIELRGFGVFTIKPRKTGIGRNPRTGEEVSIPPGKAVRFKPGKDLQSV